jgi:hypothetical protein
LDIWRLLNARPDHLRKPLTEKINFIIWQGQCRNQIDLILQNFNFMVNWESNYLRLTKDSKKK